MTDQSLAVVPVLERGTNRFLGSVTSQDILDMVVLIHQIEYATGLARTIRYRNSRCACATAARRTFGSRQLGDVDCGARPLVVSVPHDPASSVRRLRSGAAAPWPGRRQPVAAARTPHSTNPAPRGEGPAGL